MSGGFHRIAIDNELRARRSQQILQQYGTWQNWWDSLCAEFGPQFMHRLANVPTSELAETLNDVLPNESDE